MPTKIIKIMKNNNNCYKNKPQEVFPQEFSRVRKMGKTGMSQFQACWPQYLL